MEFNAHAQSQRRTIARQWFDQWIQEKLTTSGFHQQTLHSPFDNYRPWNVSLKAGLIGPPRTIDPVLLNEYFIHGPWIEQPFASYADAFMHIINRYSAICKCGNQFGYLGMDSEDSAWKWILEDPENLDGAGVLHVSIEEIPNHFLKQP